MRGHWAVTGGLCGVLLLSACSRTNRGSARTVAPATPLGQPVARAATTPGLDWPLAPARLTPSPTPGNAPTWVAMARPGARPNVRSAPSTANQPLGQLAPGLAVAVLGRSADGAWEQISWSAGGTPRLAWVAAAFMVFTTGDPATLPVVP